MIENKTARNAASADGMNWKAIVDRLPGGVGVCCIYPDDRMEMTYLNDTFYEIMGLSRDKNKSNAINVLDYIHSASYTRLAELLKPVIDGSAELNSDIRIELKTGGHRWVNVRSSFAEKLPGMVRIYMLFTNVDAEHSMHMTAEESRMAFKIASQNGDMALWLYDPQTRRISQSFSETGSFGYPVEIQGGPEELVTTGAIHPEDVALYREMYSRIDAGELSSESTVRVLNRNSGRYEWQHITLSRHAENEMPMVIGFSTKVELQKEAEVRYERENKLRQELVKDSVIYYRINLTTHMVEEMYSEAIDTTNIKLPVSMDELIANGLFDNCYERDRKLLSSVLDPENMLHNYESGKRGETFTYRRYMPGKGLRWLKASVAKLKRVSSDDVIAFFTAQDIDDEKKDRILYRDVMNEEIESLITMRVDTRQLRIIKENRALPGYTPGDSESEYFECTDEFRKALFADVIEDDIAQAAEFIATERVIKELEKQPVLQDTYCTRLPDGGTRRKKVKVFYLDESKQDIIFVRRDITDLYNEQRRQSIAIKQAMDEAKAANEAKSVFLSRMSHDMRTPLNAIIGYSGKVLRDGATEAQKDDFLDDIHSSGEYLLGIINDVLDMTKIESNKMVLHPEPYTCAEFRDNIETVIRPLCNSKGVEFAMEVPENTNIPLMLDRVRFNQIFVNILSNAVKFTPAGGHIIMSAQCHQGGAGKLEMSFAVSDTGCGMSAEFLPHAFDSFSQEYAGQSMHNEQGTGLGLSIVKQLVELMGGTISVESTLGEGSTFTVKMSVTPAGEGQLQKEIKFPAGGLNGLNILLCEDHPMNSKIAVKLLEKEGCTVDTAFNGLQGLNRFKESAINHYDCVLMDIRMPDMDGLEAAKAIRLLTREDAQNLPIIAMTANAFVEDRRASIEAGMNAHIAKPIDPMELYRTIYQLTSNRHIVRNPKILVVDDIEMNAALVARVLKNDYETIISLDGADALEQLKHNPYIIAVITDIHMPGMDGDELIRKIRSDPAYNRIALIANTQFGDSRLEEKLMRDGADDFLYKPTAPTVLLSRVRNVLAKYR